MIVYGIGVFTIWGVLSLLYKHAYNHKTLLQLNDFECDITRQTILVYSIMSLFGLISVLFALLLPNNLMGLSGWIYCGIGPAIYMSLKIYEKNSL